jgi:hypothetical protein
MKAIVVAVFVKEDLAQRQIDNLLNLENIDDYNVYFYQDHTENSPKYDDSNYRTKIDNVKSIITSNLSKFKSASFYRSSTNLHPYGLCKESLDHAFLKNDFCIFLEDDVLLAKNALKWFGYVYESKLISWDNYKFCTGEGILFDTHDMNKNPTSEELDEIKQTIKNNEYHKYFYEIDHFLTSSIFATTKEIWKEVRTVRGSRCGEEILNDVIKRNQWKSIFPLIPFAKDIGMTHDDGWSVAWLTKEGVKEVKNVYLMADEFETPNSFELVPDDIYSKIASLQIKNSNF